MSWNKGTPCPGKGWVRHMTDWFGSTVLLGDSANEIAQPPGSLSVPTQQRAHIT